MKRGAVILLVVFGLGTTMGIVSYGFFRDRISPSDWLRKEFALTKNNLLGLALNAEYGPQCKQCAPASRRLTRDWPA